ncbi:unnamed protein product [Orchesella dallaii]|uniref:Uncharacterized protein n=1 Tax=Orchesella dallaii TaxID=48710 RepID=A0ABP1PU12_9HEXA
MAGNLKFIFRMVNGHVVSYEPKPVSSTPNGILKKEGKRFSIVPTKASHHRNVNFNLTPQQTIKSLADPTGPEYRKRYKQMRHEKRKILDNQTKGVAKRKQLVEREKGSEEVGVKPRVKSCDKAKNKEMDGDFGEARRTKKGSEDPETEMTLTTEKGSHASENVRKEKAESVKKTTARGS